MCRTDGGLYLRAVAVVDENQGVENAGRFVVSGNVNKIGAGLEQGGYIGTGNIGGPAIIILAIAARQTEDNRTAAHPALGVGNQYGAQGDGVAAILRLCRPDEQAHAEQ